MRPQSNKVLRIYCHPLIFITKIRPVETQHYLQPLGKSGVNFIKLVPMDSNQISLYHTSRFHPLPAHTSDAKIADVGAGEGAWLRLPLDPFCHRRARFLLACTTSAQAFLQPRILPPKVGVDFLVRRSRKLNEAKRRKGFTPRLRHCNSPKARYGLRLLILPPVARSSQHASKPEDARPFRTSCAT